MPRIILILFAILSSAHLCSGLRAQESPDTSCPRPSPGAAVPEPEDLRSHSGVLQVDLTVRNFTQPGGTTRFCYFDANGNQSPTLRLSPGDLLILNLKNDLTDSPPAVPAATKNHNHDRATARKNADPCENSTMSLTSTNLHFHGLTVPAVCHQDDVLKTSIQPGDAPFEYKFRIPEGEPPGLYWYHPHIHGFSKTQVMGGASGAMIIEGIEQADPSLAGMPERTLVIRDQDLVNPHAQPSKSEPVMSKSQLDNDGEAANTGTGFGKPAKDLSVDFVPVPFPNYPPATLRMKPGERQLWRVLNASAITYLNLAVLFGRTPQQFGIVGIDGVPIDFKN